MYIYHYTWRTCTMPRIVNYKRCYGISLSHLRMYVTQHESKCHKNRKGANPRDTNCQVKAGKSLGYTRLIARISKIAMSLFS